MRIEREGAANQAFDAATRIVNLFKDDRERITPKAIHDLFQQNPFLTANQLVERTGLSAPTVNAALADLERLGGSMRLRAGGVAGYSAIASISPSSARARSRYRCGL